MATGWNGCHWEETKPRAPFRDRLDQTCSVISRLILAAPLPSQGGKAAGGKWGIKQRNLSRLIEQMEWFFFFWDGGKRNGMIREVERWEWTSSDKVITITICSLERSFWAHSVPAAQSRDTTAIVLWTAVFLPCELVVGCFYPCACQSEWVSCFAC